MYIQDLFKEIVEELTSSVPANATGAEIGTFDPIVRSRRKLILMKRNFDPRNVKSTGKSGPIELPWNNVSNGIDNNNKRVDPLTKMNQSDPTYINRKLIKQSGSGVKSLANVQGR